MLRGYSNVYYYIFQVVKIMADYYWVMQEIGGRINAFGGYRSKDTAEKRESQINGGEVHIFTTDTNNAKQAIAEFQQERVNVI